MHFSQPSTSQNSDLEMQGDKKLRSFATVGGKRQKVGSSTGYKPWLFTSSPCPIRVYLNYYDNKPEKRIEGIYDGFGNLCLPISKQNILKGMIYNKDTSSILPPQPAAMRIARGGRKAAIIAKLGTF